MAITNTALTTLNANIHVSSGNTVVSTMYLCNYSATARTINLYAVPNATIPSTGNQIYKDVSIAGDDTLVIDMEKLVLANGETIRANTSANSAITATVVYVGI